MQEQGILPTMNQMGYTTVVPDEYGQNFIDFSARAGGPVLDIGAAYGVTTIPALVNGAYVIANDIEPGHLEILKKKVPSLVSGNIEYRIGRIPDGLDFPPESLGAVLASRVLQFLSPGEMILSIKKIFSWLKPGGKLFMVAPTPYVSTLLNFIPLYHERKQQGAAWPGLIEDLSLYAPHRKGQVPAMINLLDCDILQKIFQENGFEVERCSFIATENFPADLVLDGRDSVGIIGKKPEKF